MQDSNSIKTGNRNARVAYAAFMDAAPKFELQAYYWCKSLLGSGAAGFPSDIFLFVPEQSNRPSWTNQLGINIIEVEYFDKRHKYCNKISMWSDYSIFSGYDYIVFNDCDIFYLAKPAFDTVADVTAGVVDLQNPPWPIISEIFRKANLSIGEPTSPRWKKNSIWRFAGREKTVVTNLNGGFYAVKTPVIAELGQAWGRWAKWCLEDSSITSSLGIHVDQIAMALALTELSIDIGDLPDRYNVPTHLGGKCRKPAEEPVVLHYHDSLDEQALIRMSGIKTIDAAVAKANQRIEHWKRSDISMVEAALIGIGI